MLKFVNLISGISDDFTNEKLFLTFEIGKRFPTFFGEKSVFSES